jgi:hypothetical protein
MQLLLRHLQLMREPLLPATPTKLLISVLLMPKLPLVFFHSKLIQDMAAVTDLVGTRNLV